MLRSPSGEQPLRLHTPGYDCFSVQATYYVRHLTLITLKILTRCALIVVAYYWPAPAAQTLA